LVGEKPPATVAAWANPTITGASSASPTRSSSSRGRRRPRGRSPRPGSRCTASVPIALPTACPPLPLSSFRAEVSAASRRPGTQRRRRRPVHARALPAAWLLRAAQQVRARARRWVPAFAGMTIAGGPTQTARSVTEAWVALHGFCPNCAADRLPTPPAIVIPGGGERSEPEARNPAAPKATCSRTGAPDSLAATRHPSGRARARRWVPAFAGMTIAGGAGGAGSHWTGRRNSA
jgi:hypothetical protein